MGIRFLFYKISRVAIFVVTHNHWPFGSFSFVAVAAASSSFVGVVAVAVAVAVGVHWAPHHN